MTTEIEPDVRTRVLHEEALGKGADLLRGAALAAVYVILARIGLGFHAVSAFASLVWPPSGIALVAMLVMGVRFWPGIALGAFVANLWNGAPPAVAAAIAAGNTGEALFAAWALHRIPGFRRTLDRLEDVLGLVVLGGVVAPIISATVGVASLARAGIVADEALWRTWRAWWLGDAIAILVLAPLLLTWRKPAPRVKDRLPLAEAAFLAILVAVASYFLFDSTTGGMASLLAPLLIWASLRFHVRGAARATFLATAIAVWATARGHGPFASASIEEGLVRLQAFMALTAATFLVLGAMTLERGKAEDAKRLAEEDIREKELRYRTLAEAVEQLMWISDAAGRVVFVNHQWEATIGPAESAHGTGWVEVIHPEDRPGLLATRQEGLAKGRSYRLECRIRTRDGRYRWILARVVPVKDAWGKPTSWFGAAADVHDLKTAQEELRIAKEAAEEANRAKDRFLATLSHELRTPLTPVLAYSSMLEQDTELAPETRRRLEVVRRNAELEARLIDDLLDLTRVATGKLDIHGANIELFEALDHAVEICRQEAAAKGITLVRESSDGEVFIRADPARLRQVVSNILNNAIKFTPPGGRIVLRQAAAPAGRIAVEISDTGSGIEPSEIPRIFQPFEQSAHGKGGLGLGLAISRALVAAQGGTLTATSDGAGRGATFRIELPAGEEGRPIPPRASERLPLAENRQVERRVLLVEDHLDSANAARELLAEISCRVVVANSVSEALRAAQSQPFDLVLSDLGLPDGSGLELMRTLKERFGLSGIAITGYGMQDDLRRAREAGFVDHLVKPITFQRLSESVERFFAEGSSARLPT